MKYTALIEAGRLQTRVRLDVEKFQDAYTIVEQERAKIEEKIAHINTETPRIIYIRELRR